MPAESSKPPTIPAGRFRDNCLRIMDEVDRTGEAVIVTKHGKPVVKIVPAPREQGRFIGSSPELEILGDIMAPSASSDDWESISNPERVVDPTLPADR
ncbi:MAG: type II toxin-antitoxin system Phd/YefM family antitoxin [bacterium]|nr:type II toxin-antitoxin system Phd/YefM family antitoxin [bacterium]MDE0217270.1 type II toxin-antitoxin system Phd/YefM family antitoxin [bacterium]